jgi:hypothetical protein
MLYVEDTLGRINLLENKYILYVRTNILGNAIIQL